MDAYFQLWCLNYMTTQYKFVMSRRTRNRKIEFVCRSKYGTRRASVVGYFSGCVKNAIIKFAATNIEVLRVTAENFSVFDDDNTRAKTLSIGYELN